MVLGISLFFVHSPGFWAMRNGDFLSDIDDDDEDDKYDNNNRKDDTDKDNYNKTTTRMIEQKYISI